MRKHGGHNAFHETGGTQIVNMVARRAVRGDAGVLMRGERARAISGTLGHAARTRACGAVAGLRAF